MSQSSLSVKFPIKSTSRCFSIDLHPTYSSRISSYTGQEKKVMNEMFTEIQRDISARHSVIRSEFGNGKYIINGENKDIYITGRAIVTLYAAGEAVKDTASYEIEYNCSPPGSARLFARKISDQLKGKAWFRVCTCTTADSITE